MLRGQDEGGLGSLAVLAARPHQSRTIGNQDLIDVGALHPQVLAIFAIKDVPALT